MSTATLVTAEELFRRSGDGGRYELIAGELYMMSPAGWRHGEVIGTLHGLLWQYVNEHHLGSVFGAETGFLISRNPDTVRAPDIAFIAKSSMPANKPTQAYWPGAPDLAVEVLSPSDNTDAAAKKIAAWLAAGAVVWEVDPDNESITVHATASMRVYSGSEILLGEPAVPGFRCNLDDIF
jgi:Uma2 family endonuclease